MKVLHTPNISLRTVATEVSQFDSELRVLVEEMIQVMKSEQGIGLAAPQIGVLKRIIVSSVNDEAIFVNPRVIEESQEQSVFREGCLSIPGKRVLVQRPMKVLVEYQDLSGEKHAELVEGMKARVVQHEIDHLNGILMIDRVKT